MFATRHLTAAEDDYLLQVGEHLASRTSQEQQGQAEAYAKTLMERGLPVLFDLRHLAYVTSVPANVLASMAAYPEPHYRVFRIPKRSGGSREIAAPRPTLKHAQLWVNAHVLGALRPRDSCQGFAPGTSIVTNASQHLRAEVILKLDIRDFFPSVTRRAVRRVMRRVGYSRAIADLLASLTTLRDGLPQGAPTSPQLANFVAYDMDGRLEKVSRKYGLTYTRYADDLTFSGAQVERATIKRLIEHVVRDAGFVPNDRKARYLHRHHRQAVTGIVVNEKLNWPRDRRRWLRQEMYYLGRFGVEEHLRRRGSVRSGYKEFMYGHVYALNMARPDEAAALLAQLDAVEWPY